MPDNLGLLLKPIIFEPSTRLKLIVVPAEGMAHQRQVETAALLRLPDMRQLVDEKTLPMQGLLAEIVRPEVAVRVKVDVAHRGHCDALRLERPPLAADHSDFRIVDRISEDRARKLDFSGRQWA